MASLAEQQQIMLETKFSRKVVKRLIRENFWKVKEDLNNIYNKGVKALNSYLSKTYTYQSKIDRIQYLLFSSFEVEDVLDELLFSILFYKKTSIQKIATDIAYYLDYPDLIDGIKTASEMITVCADIDLYDMNLLSEGIEVKALHDIPDNMLQMIQDTVYLPPMICKPRKIKNNRQSGYLTYDDSVILGKDNHHDEEQSLDVINILNNIAFSLNEEMLSFEEKSLKPFKNEESKEQYKQLVTESRRMYNLMIKLGNKFWFNWKIDSRGRIYDQGYHIHLQAASYKKSILEFAHKEVITDV
jgi:hypothetical protein